MKMWLISDCHGNIEGLHRAMIRKGLIDNHGNRQEPRKNQIWSIGDLANCVEDSFIGDIACLDTVGNIIDGLIVGNHEMPYLDEGNSFSGFRNFPEIRHKISSLMSADLIHPAIHWDNTLISHAGLSAQLLSREDNAEYAMARIEDHWDSRNFNYSWFSSVGYARGGRASIGGIFWCDFEQEFLPTRFPQIVGHTPKYVRVKGNALCIDVGAKDQTTEPFILELV